MFVLSNKLLLFFSISLIIFNIYSLAAYFEGSEPMSDASMMSNKESGESDYSDQEDEEACQVDNCAICSDCLQGDASTILGCGHRFHIKCIDRWYNECRYLSCPICRKIQFGPLEGGEVTSLNDGTEALIEACESCDIPLLMKYIESKANVNGCNDDLCTPLYSACSIDDPIQRNKAISSLLDAGARNFDVKNKNKFTIFMYLAFFCKVDSLEQIFKFCATNNIFLSDNLINEMLNYCSRNYTLSLNKIITDYLSKFGR